MRRLVLAAVLVLAVTGYGQEVGPEEIGYYGWVMDTAGTRLQGARVDIYEVPGFDSLPYPTVFLGSMTSDENGAFAFSRPREKALQAASHIGVAAMEGYSIGWTTCWTSSTKLPVIALEKASGSLGGKVVDAEGRPVEGATVYAIVEYGRQPSLPIEAIGIPQFCCVTDAEGKFRIGGLPLSLKAELCAIKEGYAWTCTFRTDRNLHRSLGPGRENIRVVLHREASISGSMVRADTGEPLAGEEVSIIRNQGEQTRLYTLQVAEKTITVPETLGGRDNRTLMTDAAGRFSFEHLVPGQYTLVHHNVGCRERGLFSKLLRIDLGEGEAKRVSVPVVAGGAVVLKGVLADNTPVPNGYLTLKPQYAEGETPFQFFDLVGAGGDTEGLFHFRVPAGTYRVDCGKDLELAEAGAILTVPSTSFPTLHFAVKPPETERAGVIAGVCVDATDKPIKGAKVYLLSDPGNLASTDASGWFEIRPVVEECRKNIAPILERKQREWADIDRMPIFIAENPRLLQAIERGRSADDAWMSTATFLIAETADSREMAIQRYNHQFFKRPVKDTKLILKPPCIVTGRVVDEDQQAIRDAWVAVDILEQEDVSAPLYTYRECEVDGEGLFSVSVPPGKEDYLLVALRPDGGRLIKHLSRTRDTTIGGMIDIVGFGGKHEKEAGDSVVSPPDSRVAGIVTDHLGRPVRNARVRLIAPAQGIDQIMVTTAEDGRFEFRDLCRTQIEVTAIYNRACNFRTAAPAEHIRLILFDKGIAKEDLGAKPAPSAAVQVTITDASTGKPAPSQKLRIRVEQKNGPTFDGHKPDAEGKVWMFLETGDYEFWISDEEEWYQGDKQTLHAELNNVYHLAAALEPSKKLRAQRSQGLPYFPEFLGADGQTWKKQQSADMAGRYKILEITVKDRATGKGVGDAEIRISFKENTGRLQGKTNADGKAYFAVTGQVVRVVLNSIAADGYVKNTLDRKLPLYWGDDQYRQTFELQPEPSVSR